MTNFQLSNQKSRTRAHNADKIGLALFLLILLAGLVGGAVLLGYAFNHIHTNLGDSLLALIPAIFLTAVLTCAAGTIFVFVMFVVALGIAATIEALENNIARTFSTTSTP